MDSVLMLKISPPIIIAEGLDLFLYDSIQEAELDLEAVDVEQGIFRGLDAVGRGLSIETENSEVRIRPCEEVPTHAQDLEELLRAYLSHLKIEAGSDPSCNLSCLVDTVKRLIANR